MAKTRLYEFISGIESSTQPDAGSPTAANDLVTLSFVGLNKQEALAGTVDGANTAFTVSETPIGADSFQLYQNGVLQRLGTHYSRVGKNITMVVAPVVGQDLDAVYRYGA